MIGFFDKESFTQVDIQSFIDNELEESIHLDFKSSKALDKSDGKKKELSKDISAFANSDGGIIIYGIAEKDHKADSISFVDGRVFTKEWIEQLINTTIQRRIPNLVIFPVRFDSEIEQTVYVVKIPKSHDSPHMAWDKRFYKRFNFESVMMEEYEVRELYGRRSKSSLKLIQERIAILNPEHPLFVEGEFNFIIVGSVVNDGDKPEEDYKVNLFIIDYKGVQFQWSRYDNYHQTVHSSSKIKISSHKNPTIYSGEIIDIIAVIGSVPFNEATEKLKQLKFELVLHYGGGEDIVAGDFSLFAEKMIERKILVDTIEKPQ